jgi:hypothetical protein
MMSISPMGAKIRSDVSRMRCSASDSEAVRRWSGTVAKAVCVTVPGLLRIIPLRSMLRGARDTRRGAGFRDESRPLMPLSGEGLSRLRVEGRIGGQT